MINDLDEWNSVMYNSEFIEEMVNIENVVPISVRCYENLFGM